MRIVLTFLAFVFVSTILSQNLNVAISPADSVEIAEIQITAARYSQTLRSHAAPIQVISSNDLQRFPTGDLAAALASAPGVQLQSGSFQTLKLTLRGIGSRSQYGTNRTRVYIDDIPLTTGDGTSVFDDLELSFASRIEITKGSYSAWYGSGMGGALRFVTKKATNKTFAADAGITAGSFGLIKLSGMTFSNFENGRIAVGISRITGDGYRQNSNFSRTSGLVSGELINLGCMSKISYLLMLSDVHAYTPSSIDEITFRNNPTAAATNWLNAKGFKEYQRFLAGIKIESNLSENWKNAILLNTNTYDQYELRPFNILDDRSVSVSIQESLRYNSENASAAIGVEALSEKYVWQTQTNSTQDILTDAKEQRSHLNAFASTELRPFENFRISLAANLNFSKYKLTENIAPNRPNSTSNYATKAILSPMVGLVYQLTNAISLYGSIGHGFSNPTVEESLDSEGEMNSNLRPEQGWTFDMALKSWFPASRINFQVSAYAIFLNDLLITKRPTEDVFYGENAGSSLFKGVEFSFRQQPLDWLKYNLSGNLSKNTFSNFTENNTSYAGKHLPGIPNSQFYSDIEIVLPWQMKIHSAFRYSGNQFADDANQMKVKGWKTVDVGLHYETKFTKKFHLNTQISVNNIFNEQYASMILINAPSFAGRPPRYYYPAQARNFLIALRFRWE